MKSSKTSLMSRGWVDPEMVKHYLDFVPAQLDILIHSIIPSERTLAVKIISIKKMKEFIPELCNLLVKEKKLYTKIAICECLSGFGIKSIKYLLPLLGKIGRNQHKVLPSKLFEKNNYPLPRDIAARTIIRIGKPALPYLNIILLNGDRIQILEAIDAIGFITFYSKNNISLKPLIKLYRSIKGTDELIEWKIVRAFEAFNTDSVISILQDICKKHKNEFIREEAARSLR